MVDSQVVNIKSGTQCRICPYLPANIAEDVSGKRIKCTDFEGFTPTG
jgi:hypothetical protein